MRESLGHNGELPEGWAETQLANLCHLNPPKPTATEVPPDARVTFVPMPAVSADARAVAHPQIRSFSEVRKGFTSFRDNDVILAKITPCFENGKAAVCRGLLNGIGFGSTEFHVLRSTGAVLPEYIYHFTRQDSFLRDGEANMTGSVGQKRVPANWLASVAIPLPPLAEQRRIVAKVEELLGRMNGARERLAKVPTLLKRFRQSILAAACSGQLTTEWRDQREDLPSPIGEPAGDSDGLPASWEQATVGHVIESLKYGTSKKCGYARKGVPVLRIPNIGDGIVTQDDMKYADLEPAEVDQLRLRTGDLLMIRSNGSVSLLGKTALVSTAETDFAYAGYLIRLRPDPRKVFPAFLNAALSSFGVRLQIELPARSTSGVNNINSDEVRALRISLPALPEQREIVRRVDALFTLADKIEARVKSATARAEKITQAILAKAFRGELMPTEAELARQEGRDYEPASVLLKRIRASWVEGDHEPQSKGRKSRQQRRKV